MDANLVRELLRWADRVEPLSVDRGLAAERLRGLARALGAELLLVDAGGKISPTPLGRRVLPQLRTWLADTERIEHWLEAGTANDELRLLCSHYVASYLVIDRLPAVRARYPELRIRLSVRTEAQIVPTLLNEPGCAVGFCAPLEFPEALAYQHWFSMDWGLVLPLGHRLAGVERVALRDLSEEPMIVFEPGSSGRQHQFECFHRIGFRPRVVLQATTTSVIVQLVEAGLGIAVLPLLPSGRVLAGRAVCAVPLDAGFEPIATGVFRRREWATDPLLEQVIGAILAEPP